MATNKPSHNASGVTPDSPPLPAEELAAQVYEALRRLAGHALSREAPGQTLQATALVHEAWLRLGRGEEARQWNGQTHFFNTAAEVMRRILIDNARRKKAQRHGGGWKRETSEDPISQIAAPQADDSELLRVHEALDRLAEAAPRKAQLVKLHYFVGLSLAECAAVLQISLPTAKRDWAFARAWLFRDLRTGDV